MQHWNTYALTWKACWKTSKPQLVLHSWLISDHVYPSLLNELDDDLMLELDETVRQNQVACQPFSRSGRAEAELFERHPELIDIIERSWRAKVDSFRLQSRLRDEDSYYASTGKHRSVHRNDDGDTDQSHRSSNQATSSVANSTKTPKPKHSTGDLMFEMEEEQENQQLTIPVDPITPSREQHRGQFLDDLHEPSPAIQAAELSTSLQLSSPADPSISPAHGSSLEGSKLPMSSESPITNMRVWGSAVVATSKLDMKEYMAQASSEKLSYLSLGLASQQARSPSGQQSQSMKLSQKERKRQQHQQYSHQSQQDMSPKNSSVVDEPEQSQTPKPSPWRVASAGQKVSLKEVLGAESSKSPPPFSEKMQRQTSNPPLTMRQTVPGNAQALRRAVSGGSQQDSKPIPMRSVSTPAVSDAPHPTRPSNTTNKSESPIIQSIRHAPPPAEPSLQLSMSDILTQQQTEKDVIRDAVAKRSLQEIQEEQAFQEWWDEESRKVREEQEQETRGKTVSPARGRNGGSRGKGRGIGKTRGWGTGKDGSRDPSKTGDAKSSPAGGSDSRGGRSSRSGKEPRGLGR